MLSNVIYFQVYFNEKKGANRSKGGLGKGKGSDNDLGGSLV